MSAFAFERVEQESRVAAWRPLDRAVLRWTRAHGGTPALASVAAWASLADGNGHTALVLDQPQLLELGLEPLQAAQIQALRAEQRLVGDGNGAPTPFVLDAGNRFYLWRNHAAEKALADAIRGRRAGACAAGPVAAQRPAAAAVAVGDGPWFRPAASPAALAADLDVLFAGAARGGDAAAMETQRRAVAGVLGRRLFVLTGGPGTGKTTTVLRMLMMLQRSADRPLRVRACAPTGKAAQRLLQSLRDGRAALLQGGPGQPPLPQDWHAALECIPGGEALTLHRLLALRTRTGVFGHHARQPVAADVVVVDEASMVDLSMMHALFDAVAPEALLLLVGDSDQLASVAAGSALMDIVSVLEGEQAPELVRLEHSFRAQRALLPLNAAVRAGDPQALEAAIVQAGPAVMRYPVCDERQLHARLEHWSAALAQLPLRGEGVQPHAALAALRQLQLLCALREGPYGALEANRRIEQLLRRSWEVDAQAQWYPGRAVLVTRNDHAARLFNGDVGLCLADADGRLRVWFETAAQDGGSAVRDLAPGALPEHEGAFAITIHKSQGSEYLHAAVLLPPDPGNRVLSRQLLYTGASRARSSLELWSSEAALHAALQRRVLRSGGLAARLGGAG